MPIYEFQCVKCRRKSSILTLRVSEKIDPVCSHCGSSDMSRLMSRFAMPRSEDARLDSLSDPSKLGDFDENDPRSVARLSMSSSKAATSAATMTSVAALMMIYDCRASSVSRRLNNCGRPQAPSRTTAEPAKAA
jgi:putative FmdB family regulatory protein